MNRTPRTGHSRASAGFLALILLIVATPIPASDGDPGSIGLLTPPAPSAASAAEESGPFDPGWRPEPLHDQRFYRTRLDGQTTSLPLDPGHIAILSAPLEQGLPGLGIGAEDMAPIVIDGWSTALVPDALRTVQGVEALLTAAAERPQVRFVSPVFLAEHFGPLIVTPDILVGFQPGVDAERSRAVLAAANAGVVTDAALGGIEGLFKLRSAATNGIDVLAAANALARHPDVRFAEPDMILAGRGTGYPTDPGFALSWGLHNSGAAWDADIDAPQAWEITTGDPSITVVIIDTGVDLLHPDIGQVAGIDTTSQSAENPLGGPVNECDNHGTPVAGCVSAMINGIGTVGVAPDCTIASGRSMISNLNCSGSWSAQYSWSAETIGWAHANGARVTNNSNIYGGTSAALEMAYETTRLDGVVHFASAGNDPAEGVAYPASLPTVNAVAALAPDGNIAGFSAPGAELAIAAPGQAILMPDRVGDAGWIPGDYVIASGTSFASPYAAGVAALMLSASPELSAPEVEFLMYDTAVDYGDPGFDTSFGHGVVNACAALGGDCSEPCDPGAIGGCLESGGDPGCNEPSCCTTVCLIEPSCCEVAWDESCVELALATCVTELPGPPLTRVSVSSAAVEADGDSAHARIAADAWHIVAFESRASNLVDGDGAETSDVFAHDLITRETTLVSVSSDGTPGNGDSWLADVSRNGRWIVFFSEADNLVETDTNTVLDVFVHDRHTGTTVKVSTREDGGQASDQSYYGVISADGRYVAFLTDAGNLVAGTADGTTDVLLHDRDADGNGVFDEPGGVSVTVVSVNDDGDVADGPCGWPITAEMPRYVLEIPFRSLAMSDDASCITFYSTATNLVADDTNDAPDVFVHDRAAGTTRRVSVASTGEQGDGASLYPDISGDGRFVVFSSGASNLGTATALALTNLYLHDRDADADGVYDEPGGISTECLTCAGGAANGPSYLAAVSAEGRYVAFESMAGNLVPSDFNYVSDVFLHDRESGALVRLTAGGELHSVRPSISGDGAIVALASRAATLVEGDTNGRADVFVAGRPDGDVNGDFVVNVDDLLLVLLDWGVCPGCDADGNGDGVVDVGDLVAVIVGWDLDCNGNGVPDELEVIEGLLPDCNGNGVPDGCESDCNCNGVDDAQDIASGSSVDCDGSGVPDECEPDCNGNGVDDGCDVESGTSPDCNGNGVPDECDLEQGATVADSGPLGPIGAGSLQSFTVVSASSAASEVTFTFSAVADLDETAEKLFVTLDGMALGSIFEEGASDCPEAPDVATLTMTADAFNAATSDGSATILMIPSSQMDAQACEGTFIQVVVEYIPVDLDDCNGNGVPDGCDIASGTSEDGDGDGVPDECG